MLPCPITQPYSQCPPVLGPVCVSGHDKTNSQNPHVKSPMCGTMHQFMLQISTKGSHYKSLRSAERAFHITTEDVRVTVTGLPWLWTKPCVWIVSHLPGVACVSGELMLSASDKKMFLVRGRKLMQHIEILTFLAKIETPLWVCLHCSQIHDCSSK